MKFPTIFIGVALTVTVFAGLTLTHQESTQAQTGINVGGVVCVDLNQPGCSAASPISVPTPALLPGLIGLGVGLLRKRKAA